LGHGISGGTKVRHVVVEMWRWHTAKVVQVHYVGRASHSRGLSAGGIGSGVWHIERTVSVAHGVSRRDLARIEVFLDEILEEIITELFDELLSALVTIVGDLEVGLMNNFVFRIVVERLVDELFLVFFNIGG